MSKTTVCGLKYLNFLAQVCRTFFWQTQSAFPQLIFPPLSRGVFSLCLQSLSFDSLTGWKSPNCARRMTLCCTHLLSLWIWLSQWATRARDTTIRTQPPLRMDIPFGKAPRECCRFSVGCSNQNEWWSVFLKGWAALRPSVKVGDHLRRFLSRWVVKPL